MKEKKRDETQKGYVFIRILGVTVLTLLMLVSTAGAVPFAYITNQGSNTVSVIDTATNTVIATVNVGNRPNGVATSPDGTKVYVTNYGGNTVSVIDTTTSTVTATVTVGNHPFGVATSPDGTKAYVTNDIDQTVSVIDTATDTVTATVSVRNQYPGGIAAAGTKVYVTSGGTDNVSVIDIATSTVTATVPVGDKPTGVTVAGTKVYVANSGSNTVSVIDTVTNTVTATVSVGKSPYGAAVTPDGTEVYVANAHDNNVSVIDTATNTVTATVSVGSLPKAFGQFIGPLPKPEIIDPSEIRITRITTSGSASGPHIYGDRVVYEDTRNGNADIYMYDLSTQQKIQISTSASAHYPAIYGDRIVWKDDRDGKSDIFMYDISTSQETQISTSGSAYSDESEHSGPDIYNDRIVWQESYNIDLSTYCLIVYDLSTQQETQIAKIEYSAEPFAHSFDFAIHGDKIVYNYYAIDDIPPLIDSYDLSTQQTTSIDYGDTPDISGDRIVWTEFHYDIYMYDLSTQQKIQTSTGGKAHNPAIYNNRIVWEDGRNGQNIHMYDLSSSKETRITTSGSAYCPDVYGDRIVWVDGNDIYVGTLKTPVLAFPGYTNPPTDLDQNGLYEDINGNGILDFDDVVAYYDNMEWIEENVPLDLFDYNDNGLIDFDDVVKLYDML